MPASMPHRVISILKMPMKALIRNRAIREPLMALITAPADRAMGMAAQPRVNSQVGLSRPVRPSAGLAGTDSVNSFKS
jgi:hypothetical protein